MNKKTVIIALAALALTGCATGNPDPATGDPTRLHERHISLQDGREISCIVYAAGHKGGLSCDWDSANGPTGKPKGTVQ